MKTLKVKIFHSVQKLYTTYSKKKLFSYTQLYSNIYLIQTFKKKMITRGRKRNVILLWWVTETFNSKQLFLRPADNLPKTSVAFIMNSKTHLQMLTTLYLESNLKRKESNLNRRGEIKGNFYCYSKYSIDYKQSLTYVIQLPVIHICSFANYIPLPLGHCFSDCWLQPIVVHEINLILTSMLF